jgi:hypothetical protein
MLKDKNLKNIFETCLRKRMKKMVCKKRGFLLWIGCFVAIMLNAGCALYSIEDPVPPDQATGAGSPPTLSNLSVSPNPTCAGNIVNLTVSYVDPDADLQFGVAAVSVNGGELSRIAFRATRVSGLLTIPAPVSYYAQPADVSISVAVRDSAGNWSNRIATTLSIR